MNNIPKKYMWQTRKTSKEFSNTLGEEISYRNNSPIGNELSKMKIYEICCPKCGKKIEKQTIDQIVGECYLRQHSHDLFHCIHGVGVKCRGHLLYSCLEDLLIEVCRYIQHVGKIYCAEHQSRKQGCGPTHSEDGFLIDAFVRLSISFHEEIQEPDA